MSVKATIAVPYVDLAEQHRAIKAQLLEAVGTVIDHGGFVLGPEVQRFEERLAALCDARYGVGVASGTDALILSLHALGIGPGDEVITSPNSFLASASCIALIGARPVFVDVRDDLNIDPSGLSQAVTPRTKAVIVVHLAGRPADMDPLLRVARQHDLHVVEDCAQAVGARYRGQPVGAFGVMGCFSMHPLKTLSACGDGGAIVTNYGPLYERLSQARNHGLRSRDECAFWGFNSRLDSVQAAILNVKLEYLQPWIEERRKIAAFYRRELQDILEVPVESSDEYCVYQTFIVQTDKRDELKQYLETRGIGTKIHYPIPIHLQKAARGLGYRPGDFPISERQARRILSLPIYPGLTEAQREAVVNHIREFLS